jgi:hypothetical protein
MSGTVAVHCFGVCDAFGIGLIKGYGVNERGGKTQHNTTQHNNFIYFSSNVGKAMMSRGMK